MPLVPKELTPARLGCPGSVSPGGRSDRDARGDAVESEFRVHRAEVGVRGQRAGQANKDGEIEVFDNGKPAAGVNGLRFVTNEDQVNKAYFDSFAGGATEEFAPRNDSYIWYDDVKVSTDPADICELNGC